MATDIRTAELRSPVDIAEYLFTRLRQLGIKSIQGVPGEFHLTIVYINLAFETNCIISGDYNLAALDYIPKCGLKWVGNCNELNAGEF